MYTEVSTKPLPMEAMGRRDQNNLNNQHTGQFLSPVRRKLSIHKPSIANLESVKLRPSYFSFPAPRSGRSPVGPYFTIPDYYGYCESNYDATFPSTVAANERVNLLHESASGKNFPRKNFSIFGAVVNSFNCFMGIGMLSLPYALYLSGWIGLILIAVIGAVMSYASHLLGKCQASYSLHSFPELTEFAFQSLLWKSIISLLLYLQLIFDISLIFALLSYLCYSMLRLSAITCHLVSFAVLIITTSHVFQKFVVKYITYIRAIGTVTIAILAVLVVSICIYRLASTFSTEEDVREVLKKILNNTKVNGSWIDLVYSCGIISFCFIENSVFPMVFHQMGNIADYSLVIHSIFIITTLPNLLIAGLGYAVYGKSSSDKMKENVIENIMIYYPVLSFMLQFLLFIVVLTRIPYAINQLSREIVKHIGKRYMDTKDRVLRIYHYLFEPSSSSKELIPHADESPANLRKELLFFREKLQQRFQRKESKESEDTTWFLGDIEGGDKSNCEKLSLDKLSETRIYSNHEPLDLEQNLETKETILQESDATCLSPNHSDLFLFKGTELQETSLITANQSNYETFSVNERTERSAKIQNFSEETFATPEISFSESHSELAASWTCEKLRIDLSHFLIRVAILLVGFLLSQSFTHYVNLIIFFGGIFGITISIIIPVLCYLKIMKTQICKIEKVLLLSILFMGCSISSFILYLFFFYHAFLKINT